MKGEMPIFNNSNTKQYKNQFAQTVAGSAWLNTKDPDDPLRTEKIKEVSDLILKYNLSLYVKISDTNGGDYTQHTALTAIKLFPQGERLDNPEKKSIPLKDAYYDMNTQEIVEDKKDDAEELFDNI